MNDTAVRLIEAPLEITFECESTNPVEFEREYIVLSEGENDAIGQWIRNAKGVGDATAGEMVIIQLLSELYRKVEQLERSVLNIVPSRISLSQNVKIGRIGYEYFELLEPLLTSGETYYGRLEFPVHPIREIGLYFKAESETLAKIVRIHQKDESEWAGYMMARERAEIRRLKGYE
jgi:hypothetical protein